MSNREAPTLTDVARKAGVNRVTASVVLNGARANTRVSEATRQRILAAAAELRYQPNAVATSLRRRRTDILGFYSGDSYTDARSPFVAQILSGLQKGCEQHRKDLLVHRHHADRSVNEIYAELANGKIDGLILFASRHEPLIEYMADSHLPVVAIADAVAALPSVIVDDAGGGQMQAEYLARKGHRRALYLRNSGGEPTSARVRREAFFEAAPDYGLTILEGGVSMHVHIQMTEESKAFLAQPANERPTAIVGWEDLSAYSALEECRARGLRVPEEMAVMGFDGIPHHIPSAWNLTTVRAPWREVAATAVSLLMASIAGEEIPQQTVLPVELFVGDTA